MADPAQAAIPQDSEPAPDRLTPPSADSIRLPYVDGVRGVAILLVLLWHFVHQSFPAQRHTLFGYFNIFLRLSWSGVDLFFVLSGFLIGGILLRNRDRANYFRVFYGRRICRIIPLYYLLLGAVALAIQPMVRKAAPGVFTVLDPFYPFWVYPVFLQNLAMAWHQDFGGPTMAVTWSLAVEEQFYLLLPLLIQFVAPRRLPFVLILFIALSGILRWVMDGLVPDGIGMLAYVLLPFRCDSLFLGVLIAWACQDAPMRRRLSQGLTWLRAGLVLGLVGMAYLSISARGVIMLSSTTRYGFAWIAMTYGLLLLNLVLDPNTLLRRLFSARWLTGLGVLAYGLYLLHEVVGTSISLLVPNPVGGQIALVVAAEMGITLVLAIASWRWIERPIIDWGHRKFRYRRETVVQ